MERHRSQVFHPSGISTRGAAMDPQSAPSTSNGSNYENEDDRTIQGLVTRPTSNQTLKYEPYGSTNQASHIPMNSFFDRFGSNSQATSQSLNQRISKLIKAERKMMKQKRELIKDISCWSNTLPNDDCKKLQYHFIKILETELESNEASIKRKELINLQLLSVNKREKRANDLKLRRKKLMIKLRDNENKVGESPATALTRENLVELECSVEVVEDQFIRSVNNGLKNSIVDYVSTLKDTGIKFKESSDYFLDKYYFISSKLTSNSNMHKIILQNKLNSAVPMSSSAELPSTRSTSRDDFHGPKYVALSPSKIGKYLDNRFDTENKETADDKDNMLFRTAHESNGKPSNVNHAELLREQQESELLPSSSRGVQRQVRQPEAHDIIDANFIIHSYGTPGSLAVRPNSQLGNNNHEWT